MTVRNKYDLYRLITQFNDEELICGGDCCFCFYNVSSREPGLDNCPLIIAQDMLYRIIYKPEDWNRRKG